MNYLERNLGLVFVVVLAMFDFFGLIEVTTVVYILAFLAGQLLSQQFMVVAELRATRTMLLTLQSTLLNKKMIDRHELFCAQNELVGNTHVNDFKKLQKTFANIGVYLHEYIDEPRSKSVANQVEKENIVLVSDSYAGGIIDTWGKGSHYKIRE